MRDTRVEDLSWLCWHCHELETRHDLRLDGHSGGGPPPPGGAAPDQPELFSCAD